ncbi:hypothetical protein Tco_0609625, partial [Tanacetum coccineum]
TLLLDTTNEVGTLKICDEEVMGFNGDEDLKGVDCDLKMGYEYAHDLMVRDLDYGLILKMNIKNPIKF